MATLADQQLPGSFVVKSEGYFGDGENVGVTKFANK
jgi:hypothetical protein